MAQINKPGEYFNTKLYTGDGASTLAITGVGFQPDFTWIKCRTISHNHVLSDVVRGATKVLGSNLSAAESTQTTGLKSFDSDGITLGNWDNVNDASDPFVSWNWKANGAGSANTDGSITSTVSASATSGFSIVSWTGTGANATIGHGLGAEPKMIFLKIRTGTNNWQVYNKSIGSGNALFLNTTDASSSNTSWQSTDATSSVFYVSGGGAVNGSGQDMIAYCFAEKQGFSKFGSYTGNSSTDGTFVYTGFKPAFLLIKNTSAAQSWWMWDNKRIGYNGGGNHRFRTNGSDSEFADSTSKVDLLSNGFKWRDGDNAYNFSGNNFIYMAFAEQPLVGTNNIPGTAR